eukprot:CAMPEP_0119038542 /NCGR_PEP_ID=MMETSP1177-20130426/7528_1 /TAXON_ID=2985 /ORGANISM="Ochromonas sp, Strain CCMP1899" /LENGTH=230 /DNA_ID=CAMNT_0007001273 /DNA_START=40 /DNA_END=732 /DNA_ORIENTATION=+
MNPTIIYILASIATIQGFHLSSRTNSALARESLVSTSPSIRTATTLFSTSGDQDSQNILSPELQSAMAVLKQYDSQYLAQMKRAKAEGRPVAVLELERVQQLKGEGVRAERAALKSALIVVTKEADQITLGIMAETGERAVTTLQSWVSGLDLPRGLLRGVQENSTEDVSVESFNAVPVYLKYGPSGIDKGDAYLKAYGGNNVGVIFQPKLKQQTEEFYQFGDLPLSIFT